MTTGFDLDEIERLLAAATPGEWAAEFDPIDAGDHATAVCLPGKAGLLGTFLAYCQHNWSDADYSERRISWKEATSNAALIVALHNSAPAMLAEIRELRAENARLREDLADSYVKLSGVSDHASDCATSSAPAITPGPCDCAVADSVRSRRINGLEAIRDVNPAIASVALLQEIARAALGEPQ